MPKPTRVVVTESQRQEMFAWCKEKAPEEACGLVAGQDGRAVKIFRATNVEPVDKRIRYAIDPAELLTVFREIDEQDLEFLGIFHSHVKSQAYPSATDIRLSYYPEAIYFMISLQHDQPELRAFVIEKPDLSSDQGHPVEIDLVVEP